MVIYTDRAKKLGWAAVFLVLITIAILYTMQPSGLIVGAQHMTEEQTHAFNKALELPCNGRIILLTPMPHHFYEGWALGPLIKIYSIHKHTPLELYCLMRHECMEEQILGVHHSWEYIWNECWEEAKRTRG